MIGNDSSEEIFLDFRIYSIITLFTSTLMAVLCLVGFYGNTISILIFTKPIMRRSPINILLAALSVVDSAVLLLSVFVFILPGFNETFRFPFMPRFYAYTLAFIYPPAMIMQTSSVWTFVLISTERFLAVCYPLSVDKFATPTKTKLALASVIILSIIYNLIRFWEFIPMESDPFVKPFLRNNFYYFTIYGTASYLAVHFLLPFGLISVLNIYIARGVKISRAERLRMGVPIVSDRNRTTNMIITVTCLFGVCNFLAFVLNIWEACKPDLFVSESKFIAFMVLDVSNIAVVSQCSVTFVVYLIYCRKYKYYFKQYVARCFFKTRLPVAENTSEELYFRSRLSTKNRRTVSSFPLEKTKPLLSNRTCSAVFV